MFDGSRAANAAMARKGEPEPPAIGNGMVIRNEKAGTSPSRAKFSPIGTPAPSSSLWAGKSVLEKQSSDRQSDPATRMPRASRYSAASRDRPGQSLRKRG